MTYWLSEFSAAKNALMRRDRAQAELKLRCERALAFMTEKGAVLGEATAYVGFGAASDDLTDAERELLVAIRALLKRLGEEIRP